MLYARLSSLSYTCSCLQMILVLRIKMIIGQFMEGAWGLLYMLCAVWLPS